MQLRDHLDSRQENTISYHLKMGPEITSKKAACVSVPTALAGTLQTAAGRNVWHRSWDSLLRQTTQQSPQSPSSSPKGDSRKKMTQF